MSGPTNGGKMDLATLAAKLTPAAVITVIAVYLVLQREQDWRAVTAERIEVRAMHVKTVEELERTFDKSLEAIRKACADEHANIRKTIQEALSKK